MVDSTAASIDYCGLLLMSSTPTVLVPRAGFAIGSEH